MYELIDVKKIRGSQLLVESLPTTARWLWVKEVDDFCDEEIALPCNMNLGVGPAGRIIFNPAQHNTAKKHGVNVN